jgi:hypothetical protein
MKDFGKDLMNELIRLCRLVPEQMLWMLCRLAERLASPRQGVWGKELEKFIHHEPCWVPDVETEKNTSQQ